jgi:hypothetical protein
MLFKRRSSFVPVVLASLSVAALLSFSSVAGAKGKLGIDVDAALPTDEPSGVDTGWGAGLRLGHQWDLPLINLTPEFAGHYTQFGGSADLTAWSLMAGGRLGIGFILSPSVFAHAGLGHFGFNAPPGADSSQTSLGYDFGAALDLTALPIVDIGAHVAWNGIAGDKSIDPLNWVAIGGHLQFTIPGL